MSTTQINPTTNMKQKIVTAWDWMYSHILNGNIIVDFASWLREFGGNVSEAAFLLATIYVSIELVAHQLIDWIVPFETLRSVIDNLCQITFTILPELILFVSLLEIWRHIRMVKRGGGKSALAWSIAYTIPVLFFAIMSLITLGYAVINHANIETVSLPDWVLIARAMAGFFYCIIHYLYRKGSDDYGSIFDRIKAQYDAAMNTVKSLEIKMKETEENYLKKLKDVEENALEKLQLTEKSYQEKLNLLQGKLENAEEQIEKAATEKQQLLSTMQRKAVTENTGTLEGKPHEIIEWLRSTGRSTIGIPEVTEKTNLSKRKMLYAAKHGAIRHTKNEEIVFVDALINWIAQEFSIQVPQETEPMLHIVNE